MKTQKEVEQASLRVILDELNRILGGLNRMLEKIKREKEWRKDEDARAG